MTFQIGPRRATYIDIAGELPHGGGPLPADDLAVFEDFDLVYRSLCALLYNYVPMSGHPGGSISSGRFVSALLFEGMDYDLSDPTRGDADVISYAAGHKALGLYAMWALRNEVARIAAPGLLPGDARLQLRLEDLLGFRRNPVTSSPLFKEHRAKALDGHPTPATPFVRLSTGASGVGVSTSLGLAYGASDYYGPAAPRIHIVEGEGGMTPGRVAEAFAAAATASLGNAIIHIDWNQSSIDSDRVCREGDVAGDYVQWNPIELAYLHDWNAIYVPDGTSFQQIVAAQQRAARLDNGQPTAIVYRTTKGWQYGIEGRASHGAGHKLCSDAFHDALVPLTGTKAAALPHCEAAEQRCAGNIDGAIMEACFWEALTLVRKTLEARTKTVARLAARLSASRERLGTRGRQARIGAPEIAAVYRKVDELGVVPPPELVLKAGAKTTLRAELGRALSYLNRASNGAILIAAADLLGSTSVSVGAEGFDAGFFNRVTNPNARLLSIGGICEDAIAGVLAGMSTYGHHIGVGSSYGAFMAPLGHIAARLHAIGAQARQALVDEPYNPFLLVCAHTGLKTGEDGPTHADPQALQLLQSNFPIGTSISLTPWDPAELWPLVATALGKRPAVIAPFVTRPNETVLDRAALGLAPAAAAAEGVYRLRAARGTAAATVVLQGSGVTYAFLEQALPELLADGIELDVYYVASAELFDSLPAERQQEIFPEQVAAEAIGITGFTLPTMYRWVTSERGRAATMHPFQKGHYLGSGQAEMVLQEAGLDGAAQAAAIKRFIDAR